MRARPWPVLAVTVLVLAAGCVSWGSDSNGSGWGPPEGRDPTSLPDREPWSGPNATLAGRVVDAVTGDPLGNATVNVQLVTGDPCEASVRMAWHPWELSVDADGRFGPREVPGPQSNGSFEFLAEVAGYVSVVDEVAWRPGEEDLPEVVLRARPAARVDVPAPGGARVAWYVAEAPDAFDVTGVLGVDAVLDLPAGRLHGVVLAPDAAPRALTVDAPAFGRANATLADAWSTENATLVRVNVTRDGAAARDVVVLAVNETGAPVAAGVTDVNGTAALAVPAHAQGVTLHARAPGGDARATGAWAGDEHALALRRPGCAPS